VLYPLSHKHSPYLDLNQKNSLRRAMLYPFNYRGTKKPYSPILNHE
jgi:hypothetical protein